jgi:hypothetical protein
MWSRRFLMLVLSATITTSGWAFDRPFPANAKRGTMTPALYPSIVISGTTRKLSVAARIWNQDNLIQVPASLPARDFTVNYTEDTQGEIDRVWILTSEEARKPLVK